MISVTQKLVPVISEKWHLTNTKKQQKKQPGTVTFDSELLLMDSKA